jgi:hypothetical protein
VAAVLKCIEPLFVNFFKTASDPLGSDSNGKHCVAPIEGRTTFPSHLGLVYMVRRLWEDFFYVEKVMYLLICRCS